MGHAITASRPLRYRRTPIEGFEACRVNGTPADCVALGTYNWEKIDAVLSGINLGSILGSSLWHSGTLVAAKQAALLGLRGIALSLLAGDQEPRFDLLKPWVTKVLELIFKEPDMRLVNVNFPERPTGICWTRHSIRQYDGKDQSGSDERSRQRYNDLMFPLRIRRASAACALLLALACTSGGGASAIGGDAEGWPRFRGPGGAGVFTATNVPASWASTNGAGIAWKVPTPAPGFNSPIIVGDRVFFSGGDAQKREVFCLELESGRTLWRRAITNVPGSPANPEVPESPGFTAPTMATDGKRLYAIFANGDCAALSLEGSVVWTKSFGALKNPYGYATSLATAGDRLIVQLDQGEADEEKSKLYALEGATGKVAWEQPRKVGSSWATPIVIEAAGRTQIITLAVPWVISYDAKDGAELWRVEGLNGEITPSPVFAGGLVLAVSPTEKLFAIRPDGRGDVTKTHVVWTSDEAIPDIASPVGNGDLVFLCNGSGQLTCLDGNSGRQLWEHDLEMECHASPSLAGGRVYVFGTKGAAVVVQAGKEFKELFRTQMPDGFHASPAFAPGRIILRGVTNIWCLAATNEPAGGAKPR
jgi:outer membrane protein assembly factor BamB